MAQRPNFPAWFNPDVLPPGFAATLQQRSDELEQALPAVVAAREAADSIADFDLPTPEARDEIYAVIGLDRLHRLLEQVCDVAAWP